MYSDGATNETGFSALPGDSRDNFRNFDPYTRNTAIFWSAAELSNYNAIFSGLTGSQINITKCYLNNLFGMSVRCIKE